MKFMTTLSLFICLLMAPLLSGALATNDDDRDDNGRDDDGSDDTLLRRDKIIPQVRYVQVGGPNIFAYTPSFVFANPGDTILFEFLQANHTLTQSSFFKPCSPLPGGVDSGFKPNPKGERGLQTFLFKVPAGNDPLWFYCKQGNHCNKLGMVFALNPTVEKDFTTFFKRAKGLID